MANESVVKEIMDSVRRIVQSLRSSHRTAGRLNLTGAQLFVIAALGEADGPLSVGDLAMRTRTDQSTVSVVVSRLVEKGLIKRTTSAIDSRRVDLTLTAKGRATQKKAPTTIPQQKLAAALEGLVPGDAAALARLLSRIVDEMGEANRPAAMLFEDATPSPRRRKYRS